MSRYYPLLLENSCSSILPGIYVHLGAITKARWKERRRRKSSEGGEGGGKGERGAGGGGLVKKGGERKREFSDPLSFFTLSKSREPLSHRLLDACKYPWQRGTTMRSNPSTPVASFLRISGWSASLGDITKKKGGPPLRREKFPFDPLRYSYHRQRFLN